VTFRRDLETEADANLLNVPRKQRAIIRKGIKLGLQAELDAGAAKLYKLLSECKRNLGTPFFSQAYLDFVKGVFGDNCEIMVVTHGNRDISAVMSFVFRDEILPYYGGGPHAARQLHGNDFMYWKVMERACGKGLHIFDYGRSQEGSGAYRFKKHWGFQPTPLSYEYYLVNAKSVPRLDPGNPKYRLLIQIWSRLPLFVSRTIGPPIARLLG
jgi:FemAB-related protein (PEP-CTERM system-associated)